MEPQSISKMVLQHDKDLYRGDPPGTGMTTRMALAEQTIEKLERNVNRLLFASVTMLLSILGDLAKNAFFK